MLGHPELVEHVATYAAERGDTELEQLCDDVLAGLTEESLLLAVVSGDPDLQDAVERGRNAGWRSRRGVQDAFERATLAITGRPYAEVAAEIAPTDAAAMRARLNNPPSGTGERRYASRMESTGSPPPGIDRLREQVYRIRYNRERRMAVEVDGVSWPVDLGEAG